MSLGMKVYQLVSAFARKLALRPEKKGIMQIPNKEAVRDMEMGSISSNERLAIAMNGMTDRDVYKLLESGVIPTDMVQEYINDGANAPILPCGSSTCEMIPGTWYNGEYYDPL